MTSSEKTSYIPLYLTRKRGGRVGQHKRNLEFPTSELSNSVKENPTFLTRLINGSEIFFEKSLFSRMFLTWYKAGWISSCNKFHFAIYHIDSNRKLFVMCQFDQKSYFESNQKNKKLSSLFLAFSEPGGDLYSFAIQHIAFFRRY